MFKFLRQEGRYRYAASGSLLGVTLRKTASVPIGSIDIMHMFPLDFEEFLIANGVGHDVVSHMKERFLHKESVSDGMHIRVMDLFKRYLLVGGLPEAVNTYLETRDLIRVRLVQRDIMDLYRSDASKYVREHALKINRIYNLIPSNMENKKKRLVYRDIEGKSGKRSADYEEEIEYLISSGTVLEVKAISNPRFPLIEIEHKNLFKLYYNDPGLLTDSLYQTNPVPVLNTECSINLGSVYECAVACQLAANENSMFYYDNRSRGEVDFLIDDFKTLSVVSLEVKSGKDYKRHVAIRRFVENREYGIQQGYVLSNAREVESDGNLTYIPIYYSMFFDNRLAAMAPVYI